MIPTGSHTNIGFATQYCHLFLFQHLGSQTLTLFPFWWTAFNVLNYGFLQILENNGHALILTMVLTFCAVRRPDASFMYNNSSSMQEDCSLHWRWEGKHLYTWTGYKLDLMDCKERQQMHLCFKKKSNAAWGKIIGGLWWKKWTMYRVIMEREETIQPIESMLLSDSQPCQFHFADLSCLRHSPFKIIDYFNIHHPF